MHCDTASTVLVIEDDDCLRELVCELLESEGFSPVGCSNGRDALAQIDEVKPSVITLDLHMPVLDGVGVLEELSVRDATAQIPVVVVSAYADDPRLRSYPQVQASLQKPFYPEVLTRVVRAASIGMRPATRTVEVTANSTSHARFNRSVFYPLLT